MADFIFSRTIAVRRTSSPRAITGFRRSVRLAVMTALAGFFTAALPVFSLANGQVTLGTAEP
jgi:hypothetical protein